MMASNRDLPRSEPDHDQEGDEVNDRRRPRRRFRGSHWRHPSQSFTPSPQSGQPQQHSPPRLRPLSLSQGLPGFDFGGGDSPAASSTSQANPETPTSAGSYSTLSKSFANELSKVFAIDEDPLVEELELSLREKNHRLSMQASELELLSQRIREAEERLKRVEEENEDTSSGRPTPPVSPMIVPPPQSKTEATEDETEKIDEKPKNLVNAS